MTGSTDQDIGALKGENNAVMECKFHKHSHRDMKHTKYRQHRDGSRLSDLLTPPGMDVLVVQLP